MLTTAELQTVIGQTAYGPDGDKLGKIGQVWVDDESAQPEFVTVQTGLFGTHESFVPVKDATATGDSVQVPFTKEQVKNAPQCDADGGHITADDGRRIYDYYGLPYAGAAAGDSAPHGAADGNGVGDKTDTPPDVAGTPWGTADPADAATGRPVGDPGDPLTSEREAVDRATSAPLAGTAPSADGLAPDSLKTDPLRAEPDPLASSSATGAPATGETPLAPSSDDAMTLSEERIQVGTEDHEVGRAKVRKYIETEHVTQSVPVRRERAFLEHEPITPDNMDRAMSGPELAEGEYEVILHEERPVVEKHVEPIERVRLMTTSDTVDETVEDDIRRERFELDGDVEDRNPPLP